MKINGCSVLYTRLLIEQFIHTDWRMMITVLFAGYLSSNS